MIRSAIDKRIFVVGAPRSGTTLVQSLLAAHSMMTSFPESHFFSRHFRHRAVFSTPSLYRDPGPQVHEFLVETGVASDTAAAFEEQLRKRVSARPFLPFRTRRVALQFLRMLDQLTLLRGKSNWIEKTPMHLHFIAFIEALCRPQKQPHFIHVIRDGLEVVSSLHVASQSWKYAYDLQACVARWNNDIGLSLDRIHAPTDHFVFYEELTARPEATLERLLAELGLAWEPDILERYTHTARRLITSEETWKANVGSDVRRSATSNRVLTEEQQRWASQRLRRELYAKLFEAVRLRAFAGAGAR